MSEEKLEVLEKSKEFWNPNKTQFWQDVGVDLVIDKREGYFLHDMDGRRLIDVHLNGGTYNLGHRNAELIEVLNAGAKRFDMGNHHFPAIARAPRLQRRSSTARPTGHEIHDLRSRGRRGDGACHQVQRAMPCRSGRSSPS